MQGVEGGGGGAVEVGRQAGRDGQPHQSALAGLMNGLALLKGFLYMLASQD